VIGKGCRGPERRKSAVVPIKFILGAANMPIISGHHVLALQSSPEGWQAPSRYWIVVEPRTASGRVVQRQALYLGEIKDTQQLV
jgi:hypothetical protein